MMVRFIVEHLSNLPYRGSQAVIMFFASNISLVNSGTVMALGGIEFVSPQIRKIFQRSLIAICLSPILGPTPGYKRGKAGHEEVETREGHLAVM